VRNCLGAWSTSFIKGSVAKSSSKSARAGLSFWLTAIYFVLIMFMGGGARSDVQSLVILRPISALMLGYALWGLTWDQVRPYRFLVFFLVVVALFVGAHLIPLPPQIWMQLSGRDIIAAVDQVARIDMAWRPISMAPSQTWNALYALVVPFAMLALMLRLTRDERFSLIPVLILIGLFSGFMGLLQVIGARDGPLYFYNITNYGSAVGLFANRNHQAIMLACLFPVLAVYASTGLQTAEQFRLRGALAGGAALFLVPLLLVTGSRIGLIVGLVGLLVSALLYRHPQFSRAPKRKIRRFNLGYLAASVLVSGIAALTFLMSRAEAFDRLLTGDGTEDLRFAVWPLILEMSGKYFPIGSGIGTFVEVYQIDEPLRLLDQEYLNHAHNDWLEILLTGGVVAALLAVLATVVWIRSAYFLLASSDSHRRDIVLGKLGASIIFMLALASVGDYPLRVSSLTAIFVIAAVWMAGGLLSSQAISSAPKNKGGAD
jgi:O-antigen ligase